VDFVTLELNVLHEFRVPLTVLLLLFVSEKVKGNELWVRASSCKIKVIGETHLKNKAAPQR
jgi:hypothetical protein